MNINSNSYLSSTDQGTPVGVIPKEQSVSSSSNAISETQQIHPWDASGFNTPIINPDDPQKLQSEVFLAKDTRVTQVQLQRIQVHGNDAFQEIQGIPLQGQVAYQKMQKKMEMAHVASDTTELSSRVFSSVNQNTPSPSQLQDSEDSGTSVVDDFNMDDVAYETDSDKSKELIMNKKTREAGIGDMNPKDTAEPVSQQDDGNVVSSKKANKPYINAPASNSSGINANANVGINRGKKIEEANYKANYGNHGFYLITNFDKIKSGEDSQLKLSAVSDEMLNNAEKINELAKNNLLVSVRTSANGQVELTQVFDSDSSEENNLENYKDRITQIVIDHPSGHQIIHMQNVTFSKMTISEALICINEARLALNGDKNKAESREDEQRSHTTPLESSMDYASQVRFQQLQQTVSSLSNSQVRHNINKQAADNADRAEKAKISKENMLKEDSRKLETERQNKEGEKIQEDAAHFDRGQKIAKEQTAAKEVRVQESGRKNTKKVERQDPFDPNQRYEQRVVDNTDNTTVKENRSV